MCRQSWRPIGSSSASRQARRARSTTVEGWKGLSAVLPNTRPSDRGPPIRCSTKWSRRRAGTGTVHRPEGPILRWTVATSCAASSGEAILYRRRRTAGTCTPEVATVGWFDSIVASVQRELDGLQPLWAPSLKSVVRAVCAPPLGGSVRHLPAFRPPWSPSQRSFPPTWPQS